MVEEFLNSEMQDVLCDPAELDKWNEYVETLSLSGQEKLRAKEKSPIPFPAMTVEMQRVYEILCPKKCKIAEYSKDAIPLRVLGLAALSVQEQYFGELQIWAADTKPDPILVGVHIKRVPYTYSTAADGCTDEKTLYIIARWGDELRAFSELKSIAISQWIEEKRGSAQKKIAELQGFLSAPEGYALDHIRGGWVNIV